MTSLIWEASNQLSPKLCDGIATICEKPEVVIVCYMIAEHFQEGILIADPLRRDVLEFLVGVTDHHWCGSMLQKFKGIISNDRITNDDLMSVPDDTIQMVTNQSDIPCQLVIVRVFKE